MKRIPLTKVQFDTKRSELEASVRDWADRACTSFDEAVRQADKEEPTSGTIWAMPAIDSKRVAGLLVELEPVVGCELPCSLIRRGGYGDRSLLATDLLARIRERCLDDPTPALQASNTEASTVAVRISRSSTLQVTCNE